MIRLIPPLPRKVFLLSWSVQPEPGRKSPSVPISLISAVYVPTLIPMISWLMDIKADENHYQELFGNTYIQNDYIFKNINGKLYYPDSISKSFKKFICKHPELPQNITLHGLRKSCASILIDMGNDPTEAQIQLGHTDVDTTLSIYRGKRDQAMRLNNINDMIDILGLN